MPPSNAEEPLPSPKIERILFNNRPVERGGTLSPRPPICVSNGESETSDAFGRFSTNVYYARGYNAFAAGNQTSAFTTGRLLVLKVNRHPNRRNHNALAPIWWKSDNTWVVKVGLSPGLKPDCQAVIDGLPFVADASGGDGQIGDVDLIGGQCQAGDVD